MIRRIVVAVTLALATCSIAGSHPWEGLDPNDLPSGYGTESLGLSSEYNINDITFSSPYPTNLTLEEQYMVAGAGRGTRKGMHPWYLDVYILASTFYEGNGYLPSEITEEMVRSKNSNPAGASQSWLDRFKSPITGEYPRLDQREFSPGNLYIAVLTEEEKYHLAGMLEEYDLNWFKGQKTSTSGNIVPAQLVGEVYYLRMYGNSDVILDDAIQYHMVVDNPEPLR